VVSEQSSIKAPEMKRPLTLLSTVAVVILAGGFLAISPCLRFRFFVGGGRVSQEYHLAKIERFRDVVSSLRRHQHDVGRYPNSIEEWMQTDPLAESYLGPIPHADRPIEIWVELLNEDGVYLFFAEPDYTYPCQDASYRGRERSGLFTDFEWRDYSADDLQKARSKRAALSKK
jgi:hypothetical protein